MSRNPLNPTAICQAMADALPTHAKDDTTSDLSSSLDVIALFVHACMVSLEFRLLGFTDEAKVETECTGLAPRLPPTWNNSLNSHSFVYAHTQSSMRFVLRVDRLGGKIEIRGLGVGDERINRLELTARDYVSSAALPLRIPIDDAGDENRADLPQKLSQVFTSPDKLTDLATLLKTSIIQRLVPNLAKEGYEESPDDRAARQDADQTSRTGARQPHHLPDPLPQPAGPNPYPAGIDPAFAPPPRAPVPAGDFPPPGFDDEYDLNRTLLRGGPPMRSDYGRSDLYPPGLGPDDPVSWSGIPQPWAPGGGRTGGMHPTFDDPLFQGPGGGGGGAGYDSQAPPGARWDPLGPGGAPRSGGGRPGGRGNGGFGGGFGGGGFGGDII
ncbi:PI31 proteasome regulator N-terminal-domain-containing protein [Podospora appendiculata]|uniref:PI31 proteasome regulator N-terminal-domain-containing protein n=1 Tax=Podospora appendiculata TaxID=314037 RepID=A0AAE0X819_9PEZI|nr:PI31 proteasome regulator N-terminal-domain-containing protein [Podospora appendiculata]